MHAYYGRFRQPEECSETKYTTMLRSEHTNILSTIFTIKRMVVSFGRLMPKEFQLTPKNRPMQRDSAYTAFRNIIVCVATDAVWILPLKRLLLYTNTFELRKMAVIPRLLLPIGLQWPMFDLVIKMPTSLKA